MSAPVANTESEGRVAPDQVKNMDVVVGHLASQNARLVDQGSLSVAQPGHPTDQTGANLAAHVAAGKTQENPAPSSDTQTKLD